jgi:hypothetical protein
LDKLISSGKNTDSRRFQKHHFAALNATAPVNGRPSPPPVSQTFKNGLVLSPVDDPTVSATDSRFSQKKPDASIINHGPDRETAGPSEDPGPLAGIWKQFRDALHTIGKRNSTVFEQAAAETLQLSLSISEKIMESPPDIDPEKLHALVDGAWQQIKQEQVARLRISPHDLKALEKVDAALLEEADAGLFFQVDTTLENGVCKIEGPRLDLQNSLREQLAVIEENFSSCCLKQPDNGRRNAALSAETGSRYRAHIPYKGRP